jgi:hypothetical protein
MTTRSHTRIHALAPLWTILVVGAALLVAAAPVAAKEGIQAELTTTIPRDATPGSTLLVEWDAFMPSPERRDPIMGSPVFIRLLPAGAGKATEARGFEKPSGSGHYAAQIVVPSSGIGGVQVGLTGEMCTANSGCVRDDIYLLLVGEIMSTSADPAAAKVVKGAVVASAAPAPAATAAPAAAATAAPPVTTPVTPAATSSASGFEPGWIAATAVVILAVIGLLAAARLIRRRGAPPSSLSSDPTHT